MSSDKPGTVPPGDFIWRTDADLDDVAEVTPERLEKAKTNAAPKAKAFTEALPKEEDGPAGT